MSGLTTEQALAELNALDFTRPKSELKEAIREVLARTSVDYADGVPRSVTLLYSAHVYGSHLDRDLNTHTSVAAKDVALTNASVGILDNTHAGKLLGGSEFEGVLARVFGRPTADEARSFLYDSVGETDASGNRKSSGLWEDISKRYVGAHSGDVVTLTPNGSPSRTFMAAEVPALLASGTIRSVNGISFEEIRKMHAEQLAQGLSVA